MRLTRKALVTATMLSLFGIALAGSTTNEKALEEIASYRQWTRVTPQPLVVNFGSPAG